MERSVLTPQSRAPSRLPTRDAELGAREASEAGRVRRVQRRLPQPVPATPRPQRELHLRPAVPADAVQCALLDTTYTTSHVWQLDTRREGGELRVCLRLVRLPRELTLVDEHRPPAFRNGTLHRGVLWLVAEEIEVGRRRPPAGRGAPAAGAPADAVSPAWNHAMRYSGGASAVQLSLPAAADPEPAWAPESPGAEAGWAPPAAPRGAAPDPWEGEDLAQVTPPDAEPTPASPRPVSRPASAVGYVAAALAPGESCAYLQALVVAPSHRRQGIAGRLLAQACRWAAGQGAVRLMADVSARNYPALRLLEKAGFSFCGYNDRCYPKNEVAIFLSIDL